MTIEATDVTESIIDYCVIRLAYSVRKYQLKQEVSMILYGLAKDAEGKDIPDTPEQLVAIRTFERILKKAREVLHERSVAGSKEARQESVGFYENMIADEDTGPSARIKARENLDKIHGVVAVEATLLAVGQVNQNVIDVSKFEALDLTIEQKKKLLALTRKDPDGSGGS